ncbi:hypothetical protein B0J12DRAFT_273831 [Macrophomina phaseolina]|uniref:Uncharacterized protein n=1 Tax=Macrophomina phaseolina TaxID=35725 RepID=A0ABQ8FYV7_9PEZI|nr:hypothetical protein B0J12DRAFT_273831 [Macrophomina phaseolina]
MLPHAVHRASGSLCAKAYVCLAFTAHAPLPPTLAQCRTAARTGSSRMCVSAQRKRSPSASATTLPDGNEAELASMQHQQPASSCTASPQPFGQFHPNAEPSRLYEQPTASFLYNYHRHVISLSSTYSSMSRPWTTEWRRHCPRVAIVQRPTIARSPASAAWFFAPPPPHASHRSMVELIIIGTAISFAGTCSLGITRS